MKIEINPELDIANLSRQFQQQQRLRIENLLTLESAEYISEKLQGVSWHLVHSDKNGLPVRYDAEKVAVLTPKEHHEMTTTLHSRAAHSYQYIYKFFPIIDAIQAGALPASSVLFQIANFVNGTEFIKFSRFLTSCHSLVKVDPQATLYEPGHFLATHDDSSYQHSANDTSTRRFAIVIGLSKGWSNDWGGQTSFFPAPNSSHSESWYPGFNTLSIFAVPTLHCVNYIAPFASKGRYSITGWLRDDPTVKRPDLGDA